jgi:ADP-ribosylglycohydrolase
MGAVLADRTRGVLFGQAAGDALGFGTEFLPKCRVAEEYPTGLRAYHQITRFRERAGWVCGDWTDDTDQMLCILDSPLDRGEVDPADIAARIRHWALSDGLGIGSTVYAVVRDPAFLEAPEDAARRYWEASGRTVASNGGVMRTSVLGVWEYAHPERVRANAERVCRLTHYDPRCVGSCVVVCLAVSALLRGEADVGALLDAVAGQVRGYHPAVAECVTQSAGLSLGALDLDEGRNPGEENRLGYTLKTLGAGLWALRHAGSFEEGILPIVHEGGDADTNAAVAGALLGARFGARGIPHPWVEELVHRQALETRADRLLALCAASSR